MKTLFAITTILTLCVTGLSLSTPSAVASPPARQAPGFYTIDISIDPMGQPLAAYQFELTTDKLAFTVVGVEGGEHPAFDHGRPPYFDRFAERNQTDRLIVAEYALPKFDPAQLPTKPVRIVTLHVMSEAVVADEQLPLKLKLLAAGDADGNEIDAKLSYTLHLPERPE